MSPARTTRAGAAPDAGAGDRDAGDGAVPEVSRAGALAYRVAAQQLDRSGGDAAGDLADLAVLDLGLQDSPPGSAAASLAARTRAGSDAAAAATPERLDDARRWVTVWAVRGAPHLLRRGDVRPMALATWPADAADAAARLAGYGQGVRKRGGDALAALRAAADAMARAVPERMAKGDASGATTREGPDDLSEYCRGCGTVHISDQLMRLAALPAGLAVDQSTTPLTLRPMPGWEGVPERQEGASDLVLAYLRLHGPATPKDVAAYLQTTQAAVKAAWPAGDLAEVRVDGRRAWLPADRLDALLGAPDPEVVRLLPRSDPWLMGRDRELLVPDAAHRKALWPVLGFPGAVLVDGEVAGTWRTKAAGKRLDLTVARFRPLTKGERAAIEDEAARVAALRGHADARVTYAEG